MPPRSHLTPGWLFGALAIFVAFFALVAPRAAQAQDDQESTTVTLVEIDNSGVSGVATLDADGDQTTMTVRLTGAFDDHLVNIARGSCGDSGSAGPEPEGMSWVTDPDGFADAVVPVPLDELTAGGYSITVHRSEAQPDELIACGDIGDTDARAAAGDAGANADSDGDLTGGAADSTGIGDAGATDATSTDLSGMPTTGIGSASQTDLLLPMVIAGLATLAAAIAIATARRHGLGSR